MEIHDDCLYKKMPKIPVPNSKPNIKDCLQPKGITHFQKLMQEIRSTFILKINDKEPGKSFETSNLPSNIDPIYTSFGTRQRDPFTVSDILHEAYNCDYNAGIIKNPGEQLNRKYEKPFNKHKIYGKASKADVSGNKGKKLIYSFKQPHNFQHPHLESKKSNDYQNMSTNKLSSIPTDIYEILHEIPVNKKRIMMKKCLGHVNRIRLQTKKNNYKINFSSLKNHLHCICKNNSNTVTLNEFYDVLNQVKVIPDPEIFEYLLKEFDLMRNNLVYYDEALDLLDWKYEFPPISKIDDVPTECQYYTTTYQDTMKL